MKLLEREPTSFEMEVYEEVRKIPRGETRTYGEIARAVGCKSAQAVGQALKRNPFAPEVPCHRVVKANGKIGGFRGKVVGEEVKLKSELLSQEGVVIP